MVSHTKQTGVYGNQHCRQRPGQNNGHNLTKSQHPNRESENTTSMESKTRANAKCNAITLVIPKWLYCYLPLLTLVLLSSASVWIASYLWNRVDNLVFQRTESVGWEMVDLFGNFDTDGDFYLSFDEALPLIQLMSEYKQVLNDSALQRNVPADEHVIKLEAHFSPLNISTMTKDWLHDFNNNYSFHGLFKWQSPNVQHQEYPVSAFLDFLPYGITNIPPPGTVYTIISAPSNVYNAIPAVGRSTRHYPPQPSGKGRIIHSLLSMLHPRPFVIMRFPPQGAMGCVRAVSKTHVHVMFRVHAEFQLNEPPRDPFWFSPAQFLGSLIIARDGSSIEHFHLYVPTKRGLNVDMEWLMEDNSEGMEVDIGFMPMMELVSPRRSRPQASAKDEINDEIQSGTQSEDGSFSHIEWDSQITEEAAKEAMELEFFPFKTIKYYNLSEAFDHSASTGKLVHSILLWGALDDQSC
ncbi:selenoprotein n [Plakobranchus ocellatus]|uniref:Selenoprotein n n=1 Tax=Plakobranchus ocellatus TaxID=259542 RepID=A0AAV3YJ70_9GAST|nr:selenoprotein n [Plakobranchus ocellatus]